MKITDILNRDCVRVPLEGADPTTAITELVDLLNDQGCLKDRDLALAAILARERTRSTGIGLGLAVPHGKSAGCRDLVMAIGKPASPIDFGSPDGRPCNMVVLLASPVDKTGPHIQALAGISRLWQSEGFRSAVVSAGSAGELCDIIEEHSM